MGLASTTSEKCSLCKGRRDWGEPDNPLDSMNHMPGLFALQAKLGDCHLVGENLVCSFETFKPVIKDKHTGCCLLEIRKRYSRLVGIL